MTRKFRKIMSLVLAILMVAAVGAVSASAVDETITPAGTQLFFDNSQTQWDHVYIYGWNYGLSGEFIELQPIATGSDIYAYTLTYNATDGSNFCLFTSSTNWSGRQTEDVATAAGMNLWTPTTPIPATGSIAGTWSYMEPPTPAPAVTATPSKNFAVQMDVLVSEFNCPGGARYTINDSEEPVEFTGSELVSIGGASVAVGETYTILVEGLDILGNPILGVTSTTTYTKVGMTTITASIDKASYNGPVYAYLFGGDRIGSAFYEMETATGPDASKNYFIYQFEGAANVIFTTTDDWATAVKLNGTAEPLVAAGATQDFALVYPAA